MTLARSKPVGILAAIALVVLSAVGLRLSDPDDNFQVINGVAGVGVKINNGEITVSRVTVGTFFIEYGKISDRTPGMFIAVTVSQAATGSKRLETSEARLLGKDVRYDSYQIMDVLTVDPGFETSVDIVFEVDPARIDGLTLEIWPSEFISSYQQRVRIDLGITTANAEQWRTAAKDRGIEMSRGTTKAIP
jgi:hypothetical protein